MTTQFVSAGVVSSGAVVNSGDTLEVLSGGTANATNVSSGGIQQVDAGGLASATVISSGGTDLVFGSDTHDQVLAGGVETIGAGGVVSAVTGSGLFTADSGTLNVLAGGTLFNAIVYSGGLLNISSGGTAAMFAVSSGGSANVLGTSLSNSVIESGGVEVVSSGGIVSGAFGGSGNSISGTLDVLSGGALAIGAVFGGGVLNVSAGGTAANFTVSSGGSAIILGTSLSNTFIQSGGVEVISSGGVVTGGTSSGTGNGVSGTVNVLSGGAFGNAVVSGGGALNISAGGTAHNFAVSNGGLVNVAGTTTGIALILSGGVENVLSGGLLSGAKQSGTSVQGTLNISAGGTAAFLGVASGGLANVFGTITNNETVSGGGVENVFSGGVVTGTSSTGNIDLGTLNVSSGGSAAFIVISSGGVTTIASSGTAHDVTISSGGLLNVLGAVTSDTIVLSGGVEMISSGGVDSGSVARGTIVSGGTVDVLSGGRFDFGTVSSGGVLNVFGTTNSTNEISSGGVENVWSGGLVGGALDSGTVLAGGTLNVFSGGTAAFVEISIGLGSGSLSPSTLDSIQRQVTDGSIFISSPPPFSVTWLGGTLNVSQGGLAHDIDVGASGFLNVLGSTTSNVRVFSGGTVNVSSGGVLYSISQSIGEFDGEAVNVAPGDVPGELNFGIIVNPIVPSAVLSGGVLNVSAGGWANGVVISSGSIENDAGSTTFTTVLSGGNLFVSSGGAGGIIMVSSGGSATVLSGGSLNGMPGPTVVVSGGVLTVSAGGTTTATDFEWGGLEVVLGVASTTVLGIGGQAIVSSGGIASSMINYSGAFDILSGGAAISASLANGFYTRGIIAAGGTATGTTNGGNVTVLGADVSATIFGLEFVSSGGTLSNATVSSGGMVELFAGAAISGGLTLKPGATIEFGSGYVASGFVVSSGITAVVLSGGAALSNTISGLEVLYGGVASATTISGGTMELALGGSANGAITFAGPGGTLQIDGISMPANTISGFMPGDTFYLSAVPFNLGGSADLLLGNVLQITEAGQQYDLNLDPSQDFAGKFFHLNAIASGGILVTEDITPCYCAGSLILTDRGEVEVERLAIGDHVVTANGAARPIRWIGRRSYAGRFARGSHVLPICIKAGALDVDQPRRDLWVSPQHAMFLEGALIEAIDLINGVSIVQADRVERVDYFHIELDTHDIIIAEGALSESFVDDDSRGIFQNAHEFATLYPSTPIVRPARYCAPRVARGAELEAARRQIAQRAGIPYTPSSNAKRPRALVVDSWVPQLGHDRGANAILDHIGALQAAGFEVSFLALRGDSGDASALSSLGVSPLAVPRSGRFSDFARAHAGQFDLVYLHRVETATRCLRLARRYFDAQIIYSVADLHHLRLQAQSQLDADHVSELMQQAYQFALQELSAALSADCVITHSVTEAERLEQLPSIAAAGKVRVVPWAVPLAPVETPFADRSGLAFIGSFAFPPNVDAARWLVSEIMPLVWRKAPEVRCLIVGSDLSDELRHELARPGVDVLGRVDRLSDVFERIRLNVAPLRFGAGIKDKVLRSMAAGLPCVGTPEAFRGMHALPAVLTNTCQRETASELAAAIVRMHRDKKANANCAEAGSRYVAEGYNVSRINSLIRDIARPALERRRAMTRTGPGHTVLQFGGKPHNNEPTVAGGSDRTMRVVFR